MSKKIAFITYESPYARCGGIAAVIGLLPGYVQQASGLEVAVFTPFHHRIASTSSLRPHMTLLGKVRAGWHEVQILRYTAWSHIGKLPDAPKLLGYLHTRRDAFTRFLLERFPEDLQCRLAQLDESPESLHALARSVVGQLNLLLKEDSLYEQRLFTSEQNQALQKNLAKNTGFPGKPGELNYLVLQTLYPDCFPPVCCWTWYFLAARDFFSGYPHPYALAECRRQNATLLSRDARLFGFAVAAALPEVDPLADWILLLQDWEAATTSLALNGHNRQYKQYLVLHNSYDSPLDSWRKEEQEAGSSVLGQVIPRLQRPLMTVSEQFARDLTTDLFQTGIMAGHLQKFFHSSFVGVDNGPFSALHVPAAVLEEACRGSFCKLLEWKLEHKNAALTAMQTILPRGETPVWGDLAALHANKAPCWFVMAGRDDPRQKGYDLAAAAIRNFLNEGGNALFFFFPIPGDEGLSGLAFLEALARDYPAHVAVFPFRWQEGYFAALRGASYGLMPSFYEPFGGAHEFYLNGTVGIARATGGLIQQIIPLRAIASYSHAAQKQVASWHAPSSHPTGLLFREQEGIASALADWEGINQAAYELRAGPRGRIGERMKLPTYREMVSELFLCLKDAAHIYSHRQELYYRMLSDGIIHIQNSFSWERTAQEYVRNIL